MGPPSVSLALEKERGRKRKREKGRIKVFFPSPFFLIMRGGREGRRLLRSSRFAGPKDGKRKSLIKSHKKHKEGKRAVGGLLKKERSEGGERHLFLSTPLLQPFTTSNSNRREREREREQKYGHGTKKKVLCFPIAFPFPLSHYASSSSSSSPLLLSAAVGGDCGRSVVVRPLPLPHLSPSSLSRLLFLFWHQSQRGRGRRIFPPLFLSPPRG